MRKHIRIENPVAGAGWTSRQKAKKFVANGVAEWVRFGDTIRFITQHPSRAAVQRSVDTTRNAYDRASGTGMASLKAIQNLPAAGDVVRVVMLTGRRTRKVA
jgi:hypothetical protein